jgi:hypothetical protein
VPSAATAKKAQRLTGFNKDRRGIEKERSNAKNY